MLYCNFSISPGNVLWIALTLHFKPGMMEININLNFNVIPAKAGIQMFPESHFHPNLLRSYNKAF